MDKLAANPQFQEAQQLMAKLEQQSGQSADSQSSELTQQQLKAMADRLEELAKELNTDAKLRDYADRVLQAAKSARLGNPPTAKEMLQAFGLDQDQNPQFGLYGKGGTSPGVWEGCLGHLLHTDKSSLLHVKVNDRIITSQLGKSGPESYQEFLGPSRLTPQSGIPYQAVMPKYEKSAESALSRGDVPPQMRATVRDYFESLRQ
jgi:hypothetical protein